MNEWYLEYLIHKNRTGLLGDIASVVGMLGINIVAINGVENQRRGLLIQLEEEHKVHLLKELLNQVEHITISAFRQPTILDRIMIRHGRKISRDTEQRHIFRFLRDEIGILVDFLGELFQEDKKMLIGVRGMPRVGKTESIVAGCVCANKRWNFISSTLLRQTAREHLIESDYEPHQVYIIDAAVTVNRASERHQKIVREIIEMPVIKVIEHPDLLIDSGCLVFDDFDLIIELRNHEDDALDEYIAGTLNNLF